MSDDQTSPTSTGATTAVGAHGTTAVVEHGSHLPEVFENPGLPLHIHRSADLTEKGAKRAELQVAVLFTISIVGALAFMVAYWAIPTENTIFIPGIGKASALNVSLGVSLALALLGIGIGAVHWAKTLMPDTEVAEERHPQRSGDAAREKAVGIIVNGVESTQLARRPMIKVTLGAALGLFALPFVVQLAGSMGPGDKGNAGLRKTIWDVPPTADGKPGTPIRLMHDPAFRPIKAADVTIGSVIHVMPETLKDSTHVLEDKAKAAVIVMRLNPDDFADNELGSKAKQWGYEGIVAYSKICTHVGCPVGLYEHQTHHLLCPCHQSTFDVTEDCKVIFGPAGRPLPQLKITVDSDGYLVAPQGFTEPVGPSFWERAK